MEAWLGELGCVGFDSAVCKLNKNEKETSFFCIYFRSNICRKGCFLLKFNYKKIKEKGKTMLVIVCLMGVAIGSQIIGTRIYERVVNKVDHMQNDSDEIKDTGSEKSVGSTQIEEGKVQIVLDSGHGGSDPGKVGINGVAEKDINLIIAKKVEAKLKEKNISVFMTRTDEKGLANSKVEDMKTRVSMINENKPILAVSIHQNSYEQEEIHGAQVFYYTHSQGGKQAAEYMQTSLLSVDAENKRQAKANDTYYMLKRTEVPVIIVECGFLSNRKEAEKLNTDEYQEQIAEAICNGIETYLKSIS